jgi:hypothetical protein
LSLVTQYRSNPRTLEHQLADVIIGVSLLTERVPVARVEEIIRMKKRASRSLSGGGGNTSTPATAIAIAGSVAR